MVLTITAAAAAFVVSAFGTRVVLELLVRRQILDIPVERSSHTVPTPRGGGAAAVVAIIVLTALLATQMASAPPESLWIALCAALIALPSAIDDVVGLPVLPRLVAQVGLAVTGSWLLTGSEPVFQGLLAPRLDLVATVILWVGYINQFNFVDGIDGNAGSKGASLGVGLFALALVGAIPGAMGAYGLVIAAACLGFLVYNWHPARVFMGDVGSVTLGFLFAWLLLRTAREGQWAPALILPMPYMADTIVTYTRKIARGDRFWRPHRDYTYQRAVAAGSPHDRVVKVMLAGNVVIVAAALLAATTSIVAGLALAITASVAVVGTLEVFSRG